MTDAEPKKALKAEEEQQVLPLVIEIMPGQAGEGLVDIYQPGSYEGKSLRQLCQKTLDKKDLSIEEQLVLEDIQRQLKGGKFLSRGQDIDSMAQAYAVMEETEAGEKYLYIPVRAIKPQEGGREG
ncbi:MAG: hypothetical protein LJE88_01410 [Deltaproteobacteria bacterium]|jgi:hypothetical protein|nr:hypothetical protein [Deltaproteobacteria bacterium]